MKRRNTFILLITILMSCSNSDKKPDSIAFNNKNGILYFSFPQEGQTILAVFLPYGNVKQDDSRPFSIFDSNFGPGIKISTSSLTLFDKLSRASKEFVYLSKDHSQKIFWIPNVKIYYHITKPMYDEKDVIDSDLNCDTLILKGKEIFTKYYFGHVTIDDIEIK